MLLQQTAKLVMAQQSLLRVCCLLCVPGLGVVQALPGPLFNFSAYLGVIIAMNSGYNFMVGAVLAWFGLFSPGVMIIFGE